MKLRIAMALALFGVTDPVQSQDLDPAAVEKLPSSKPSLIASYGPDSLQFGELRLPAGKGPFKVVEVIHGGCWTKGYATRQSTAALATAITAMGYATWNIEYRQVGDPGAGWPGTFQDWAAATDYLRVLARSQPITLEKVSVVGHSAGAHAALWVGSRSRLPAQSPIASTDPLPVDLAVAIDGPGELAPFIGFDAQVCGQPVIVPLIGGTPAEQPERYLQASPIENLPAAARFALISSQVLLPAAANRFSDAASAKGQKVSVLKVHDAGHFDIIAPGNKAWELQVGPFLRSVLP